MSSLSLEGAPRRWRVLADVALLFSDRKTSEVPRADLTELEPELGEWVDRGVLIESGGRIRFFHETLFDYVFARAFAEAGRSLVQTLLDGPQDLTRRAMVRQVLDYQRSIDRDWYSETVRELLIHPDIRFHLRDVVFTVLREDPAPSPADWATIEPFVLDEQAAEHPAAWSVLIQPAWFDLCDREVGAVLRWAVSSDAKERDRATSLLRVTQRDAPGRIAGLIRALMPLKDWQMRSRWIFGGGEVHRDRAYFDLLLEVLDDGLFDDGERYAGEELWYATHELPARESGWAIELLDRYLRRGLNLARGRDPFDSGVFPTDSDYWPVELVKVCAREEPLSFAQVVVPFVAEIIEESADHREDGVVRTGDPWSWRHVSSGHGFKWAIFEALDEALRAVSQSKPRSLHPLTSRLLAMGEFESARYLLYRAWAANPDQFADAAIGFLLQQPAPFRCGFVDSPFWVTRELIQAVDRNAALAAVRQLEEAILDFYPEWERGREGRRGRGFAQWTLLEAIADRRLTNAGRKRREEWRRKFAESTPRPIGIQIGRVGPPISEPAAKKMTDRQWLRAIRRYDTEENREDWLKGGALELSRVLEVEAKEDPERFGRLALRFPPTTNEYYVEAILRALADADAAVEPALVFAVLRHFWSLPGHPGGRWVSRLLGRVADQDIPDEVLDIVAWFATSSSDPEADRWSERTEGPQLYGGDPFTAGINSVRGSAAEGLSMLIWPRPERLERFRNTLESLVADSTVAVRACAANTLRAVFRHDPDLATELFLRLVQAPDKLLATPPAEEFLRVASHARRRDIDPILERMLRSTEGDTRLAGGRQSALAALGDGEPAQLVELAFEFDAMARRGVAEVAAANVANREVGPTCEVWLRRLFDDDEDEVRRAASQWARNIESFDADRLSDLASAYVESRGYSDDEGPLLQALDQSLAPVSGLALRAVTKFVERRGSEVGNVQRRSALYAGTASKLAIRAYSSAESDPMREQALDVIDQLLAARVSHIAELLSTFD